MDGLTKRVARRTRKVVVEIRKKRIIVTRELDEQSGEWVMSDVTDQPPTPLSSIAQICNYSEAATSQWDVAAPVVHRAPPSSVSRLDPPPALLSCTAQPIELRAPPPRDAQLADPQGRFDVQTAALSPAPDTLEILNISALCRIINLSRATAYNLMKSDQTFPKKIKLSPRRVGFLKTEVIEWLQLRRDSS